MNCHQCLIKAPFTTGNTIIVKSGIMVSLVYMAFSMVILQNFVSVCDVLNPIDNPTRYIGITYYRITSLCHPLGKLRYFQATSKCDGCCWCWPITQHNFTTESSIAIICILLYTAKVNRSITTCDHVYTAMDHDWPFLQQNVIQPGPVSLACPGSDSNASDIRLL